MIAGAALVALIVSGVALTTSGAPRADPVTESGTAAQLAGQALERSPGVVYSGTYAGARASFTITRAGTARGSYAVAGGEVTRVDIDDTTYVRAPAGFWRSAGQSADDARNVDGQWAKAPHTVPLLDLANLSPEELGRTLEQGAGDPHAVRTRLNGTEALKMSVAGMTCYVTAHGPRRLLRVEGAEETGPFSFDAAPLTAPERDALFSALRADVRGMEHIHDFGTYGIGAAAEPRMTGCDVDGCTVTYTGMAVGDNSTQNVRLTMSVDFHDGPGYSARTVSSCSAGTTTRLERPRTLSCRTHGPAWSSWFRSHDGRFTVHYELRWGVTVGNGGDVAALLSELSREQPAG